MRNIAVITALIGFAMSASALAAAPVAELSRVAGLVRVARAQTVSQWIEGRDAMPLYSSDRVRTLESAGARAEIRFANGSLIKLANRTTLEIKDVKADSRGKIHRVATRLWSGMVRAVVAKMEPQDEFAVISNHAVASVKGTDFFFDGSSVTVVDERDSTAHKVLLSDINGKNVLEILEGMRGGIHEDGSVDAPTTVDPKVIEGLIEGLTGGRPAQGTGMSADGEDGESTEGGDSGEGGDGGEGEGGISSEDLYSDLEDFVDSQERGDLLDRQERLSDIQTGKVLLDMNGFRVRMEEYVLRPDPQTIQHMVLNTREAGPNKGLTYIQSDLTFNKTLPDNFEDIRLGLPDAFADPSQAPEYYPTSSLFLAKNAVGDYVKRTATYWEPSPLFGSHQLDYPAVDSSGVNMFATYVYNPGSGTWTYNETGEQTGWGQKEEDWLFVGTALGETPKEHFLFDRYGNIEKGWYAGCRLNMYTDPDSTWDAISSQGDTYAMNNMYPVSIYADVDSIPMAGLPMMDNPFFGEGRHEIAVNALDGMTIKTIYGDGTFLSHDVYAVADSGLVITQALLESVAAGTTDASALGDTINFESVFRASEFADPAGFDRTIDLVMDPWMYEDAGVQQTLHIPYVDAEYVMQPQ